MTFNKVQTSLLFLLNDRRFLLPEKNALFSINHRVVGCGNVFLAFIKMTFYLKAIADSFNYQKKFKNAFFLSFTAPTVKTRAGPKPNSDCL